MALLSTEGGSILSYLTQHPTRTSLGLSVVAGVLGFLAIVRWYIKQPGAGNNAGLAMVYTVILLFSGPTAALLSWIHIYTLLAYGPSQCGIIIGCEYAIFRIVKRFYFRNR
jgi:hypothetical protein